MHPGASAWLRRGTCGTWTWPWPRSTWGGSPPPCPLALSWPTTPTCQISAFWGFSMAQKRDLWHMDVTLTTSSPARVIPTMPIAFPMANFTYIPKLWLETCPGITGNFSANCANSGALERRLSAATGSRRVPNPRGHCDNDFSGGWAILLYILYYPW